MMTGAMAARKMSTRKWLAVLALGALASEVMGRGATAAIAPPMRHLEASAAIDADEAAAPASLQARVVELEAASEELAAKLARARRELSEP
jgi:hypothetical protein